LGIDNQREIFDFFVAEELAVFVSFRVDGKAGDGADEEGFRLADLAAALSTLAFSGRLLG